MEQKNSEMSKMPEMIMCGDHPSITKAALNTREGKLLDKEKLKDRVLLSCAKVTPTSSRTDRAPSAERSVPRRAPAGNAPAERALIEALGSFRWPPYLICVWVCVLVITHALYALTAALDHAVPALRNLCQYFREWTEESWRSEGEATHKVYPVALGCATGVLYAAYACAYGAHCVSTWAIDPLRPPVAALPSPPAPADHPAPLAALGLPLPAAAETCIPTRPNLSARDFALTDYIDDGFGGDKH